ncbi:GGDEF domain-containing protein [Ideonella sp.]|uniref:GGDEF domain-containing protein n=1 Tax=Ideonella sp. TaxID=1929293 RepID=UPI002B473FF0|nr:GGDEF domain-containing protein [Ideonella sp.]HJV71284.1 GGDEF domain-containing protein [Ideonella sp.]
MDRPSSAADLIDRIEQRRAQCRRARAPLALLCIEVEDLAGWRERHGDAVVRSLVGEMGLRLRRRVRDSDEVLSCAGHSFAVLLPGVGAREAAGVCLRLQTALGSPYRIGTHLVAPAVQISQQLWPAESPALATQAAQTSHRG